MVFEGGSNSFNNSSYVIDGVEPGVTIINRYLSSDKPKTVNWNR